MERLSVIDKIRTVSGSDRVMDPTSNYERVKSVACQSPVAPVATASGSVFVGPTTEHRMPPVAIKFYI
jgi:hypothetical protein